MLRLDMLVNNYFIKSSKIVRSWNSDMKFSYVRNEQTLLNGSMSGVYEFRFLR